MSNSYLQFSEELPLRNKKEVEWMERHIGVFDRWLDHKGTEEEFAEWDFLETLRDKLGMQEDHLDFSAEIEDYHSGKKQLWVHADESGNPDQVAEFIQYFFKQMRPDGYWSMTWATTESKPTAGAFSGGGVFVTARKIQWMNAWNWTGERMDKAKKKAAAAKKAAKTKSKKTAKKKAKK